MSDVSGHAAELELSAPRGALVPRQQQSKGYLSRWMLRQWEFHRLTGVLAGIIRGAAAAAPPSEPQLSLSERLSEVEVGTTPSIIVRIQNHLLKLSLSIGIRLASSRVLAFILQEQPVWKDHY